VNSQESDKRAKVADGVRVKLPREMTFEDAVRHVLKAGPMPKKPKGKQAEKRGK
jgi:hypothetical protein